MSFLDTTSGYESDVGIQCEPTRRLGHLDNSSPNNAHGNADDCLAHFLVIRLSACSRLVLHESTPSRGLCGAVAFPTTSMFVQKTPGFACVLPFIGKGCLTTFVSREPVSR